MIIESGRGAGLHAEAPDAGSARIRRLVGYEEGTYVFTGCKITHIDIEVHRIREFKRIVRDEGNGK